ncbi:MAG TPA: hypothetical protein P5300_09675, partial [Acidobacteriota bacterium]|nr:hypothetical protein [Acidobacteriota bacterium]
RPNAGPREGGAGPPDYIELLMFTTQKGTNRSSYSKMARVPAIAGANTAAVTMRFPVNAAATMLLCL